MSSTVQFFPSSLAYPSPRCNSFFSILSPIIACLPSLYLSRSISTVYLTRCSLSDVYHFIRPVMFAAFYSSAHPAPQYTIFLIYSPDCAPFSPIGILDLGASRCPTKIASGLVLLRCLSSFLLGAPLPPPSVVLSGSNLPSVHLCLPIPGAIIDSKAVANSLHP